MNISTPHSREKWAFGRNIRTLVTGYCQRGAPTASFRISHANYEKIGELASIEGHPQKNSENPGRSIPPLPPSALHIFGWRGR